MGRTNSQPAAHDPFAAPALGMGGALSQAGDGEPARGTPLVGERAERSLASWESAWIDLGGEG